MRKHIGVVEKDQRGNLVVAEFRNGEKVLCYLDRRWHYLPEGTEVEFVYGFGGIRGVVATRIKERR